MNWIDKFYMQVAPGVAAQRQLAKARALTMESQVKRLEKRKYEGATKGRRGSGFGTGRNLSPNQEVNTYNTSLRERVRHLYKNTGTTRRAVKVIANNVVGLGIMPSPRTKNTSILEVIKEQWKLWGEESVCDYNEKLNFYGIQKLIAKTKCHSGDVFILRRRVPRDICDIGIQLQVLLPEYLDHFRNLEFTEDGGWIQSGIEYNKHGKIIGYYFFSRHPSERYTISEFYPVKDVIHVHEVDFPGQDRGVPEGSATTLTAKDLDEYKDAELMGKKIGAAFAGFITSNSPDAIDDAAGEEDEYDDPEKLEPGTIYKLFPGETMSFSTPPLSQNYAPFIQVAQRDIAADYMITYEQLTGDLSNVNFSSGRMGWLESSRNFDDWQWSMIIPMFCKKAYGWFLEALQASMYIVTKLPKDLDVQWTTPRREMIDPVKETTAMLAGLSGGAFSWQEKIREMGYEPDVVFKEIIEDIQRFKDAGLPAPWMAAQFLQLLTLQEEADGANNNKGKK